LFTANTGEIKWRERLSALLPIMGVSRYSNFVAISKMISSRIF
jgi:hypothetical protein